MGNMESYFTKKKYTLTRKSPWKAQHGKNDEEGTTSVETETANTISIPKWER